MFNRKRRGLTAQLEAQQSEIKRLSEMNEVYQLGIASRDTEIKNLKDRIAASLDCMERRDEYIKLLENQIDQLSPGFLEKLIESGKPARKQWQQRRRRFRP